MNNFEKIAKNPEALGDFLGSLECLNAPWETDFCRAFCDSCEAENCEAERCEHLAERDNPLWWLGQEAKENEE